VAAGRAPLAGVAGADGVDANTVRLQPCPEPGEDARVCPVADKAADRSAGLEVLDVLDGDVEDAVDAQLLDGPADVAVPVGPGSAEPSPLNFSFGHGGEGLFSKPRTVSVALVCPHRIRAFRFYLQGGESNGQLNLATLGWSESVKQQENESS
jgi:hypothetical protein